MIVLRHSAFHSQVPKPHLEISTGVVLTKTFSGYFLMVPVFGDVLRV